MYVLSTFDVVGNYPYEYLSVSVQCIFHVAAPLFTSKLGLYDLSQTILIVPFLIYFETYSPSDSPSVLSFIHVSLHSLQISYIHCGVLVY